MLITLIISPQVFKQASCIPDQRGICPTSLRVSDTVTKLWVRCGDACWSKNIFHEKNEVVWMVR